MTTVYDVAAYILGKSDSGMSTMKLQKLTYFAQGWSLAILHRPIFNEDFEAWARGPVSRPLYWQHRGLFSVSSLSVGDANELEHAERVLVDAVLKNYGGMSGVDLSELSHAPGGPWETTRQAHAIDGDGWCDATIPKDAMKAYFARFLKQPAKTEL